MSDITIHDFINKHRRLNHNSQFFSQKTLDYFGEKLSDMHIFNERVKLKLHSGELRECFVLSRLQREHPDGPKRTLAYFDADTLSEVKTQPAASLDDIAGAEFWRDISVGHGRDEAQGIFERYLDTQLQTKLPEGEVRFCRELFTAMYEDSLQSVNPAKLVYPYDFKTADDRTEASLYHNSRKLNAECAKTIDETISKSCYETNYYNLDLAAMKVIHDYGFERVNMVLARNIHDYDGRFTAANKQWAKGYDVTSTESPVVKAFEGAVMNTHPILIDSFTNHTKKLYQDLGAERHALPGVQETGTNVKGYDIVRSVQFDNDRGFAIGLNPHAVNQFVCWQFTAEQAADGTVARDFYWGNYFDEAKDAALNYTARVISHMDGTDIKEVRGGADAPSLPNRGDFATGRNAEPNGSVDGKSNDRPQEREAGHGAADGKPSAERSPVAQSPSEKPSVLKQIREARSAPKPPPKPKQEQGLGAKAKTKSQPDLH